MSEAVEPRTQEFVESGWRCVPVWADPLRWVCSFRDAKVYVLLGLEDARVGLVSGSAPVPLKRIRALPIQGMRGRLPQNEAELLAFLGQDRIVTPSGDELCINDIESGPGFCFTVQRLYVEETAACCDALVSRIASVSGLEPSERNEFVFGRHVLSVVKDDDDPFDAYVELVVDHCGEALWNPRTHGFPSDAAVEMICGLMKEMR